MLRVLVVFLLAAGMVGSLSHISEADHDSHQARCSVCGVFAIVLIFVALVVVPPPTISHWFRFYFNSELRRLYYLASTGRSPPALI